MFRNIHKKRLFYAKMMVGKGRPRSRNGAKIGKTKKENKTAKRKRKQRKHWVNPKDRKKAIVLFPHRVWQERQKGGGGSWKKKQASNYEEKEKKNWRPLSLLVLRGTTEGALRRVFCLLYWGSFASFTILRALYEEFLPPLLRKICLLYYAEGALRRVFASSTFSLLASIFLTHSVSSPPCSSSLCYLSLS